MKKLFLILILTFTHLAQAISCSIDTYSFIYNISSNLDGKIIKRSDCSIEIQNEFIERISNSNGQLPVALIESQLQRDKLNSISITPQEIKVTDLKSYIQDRIKLTNNRRISSLKSLTHINSINSDVPLRPTFDCKNCNRNGERNLKLQVEEKFYWLSMTIKEPKVVWVPQKAITAFSSNLEQNNFQSKLIYDEGETNYFFDIKNIRFYKTTQTIHSGTPLLASKLTPNKLIHSGKKVTLFLRGKNISLKSTVIANQNGYLDEVIELKNPKSNKKFIARVIDYNTAEVQL